MAALASPPRPQLRPGASGLEELVHGFDRQPAACRAEILKLFDRDQKAFYAGAIQVLRFGGPARGVQQVASLLVSSGMIQQALSDPALNMEQAIELGKLALQTDAALDINLARQLAEDVTSGGDSRRAARLLNVLATISSGSRITAFLMRLMRHPDPTLRSKAVLLIGRTSRSVKWVQSRLGESDPRTRASAIEALWGVDTVEARDLLRTAARDGNNRVAGNALIALYRIGDTWMVPQLMQMAFSDSNLFRASAAWVMGETGHPRFKEVLAKLMGESDAMVRRRAFLALSRLKTAAQARDAAEWRVAGRIIPSSGNWRQIRLEVGAPEKDAPRLLPTEFVLCEDGKPVTQYQVEERPNPEACALTLLVPRSPNGPVAAWRQGATAALQWKRPSDLWQLLRYLALREAPDGVNDDDANPPFMSDRDTIATALGQPAGKLNCADFWNTLRKTLQAGNAPARGVRQVIAVLVEEMQPPADFTNLISAAMNSKTAVHVITRAPSPALEDLCRRSQGSYATAASDLELPLLVEETHLAILARFHISYLPPAAGGRILNVKVFGSRGWGETNLPLA